METKRNTEAIQRNTEATQQVVKQLQQAVKDIQSDNHSDHDLQIQYVQCIVNLFGSKPGQIITQEEFDKCLAGTRIDPATQPAQPAPTKTQSSPTTASNTHPQTNNQVKTNNGNGNSQNQGAADSVRGQANKAWQAILRTTERILP